LPVEEMLLLEAKKTPVSVQRFINKIKEKLIKKSPPERKVL
jgi:hypothetical protein